MVSLTFLNPVYLWFLVGIPLLIFIHYVSIGFSRRKALKFANFEAISKVTGGILLTNNNSLLIMRIIVITCIILGVAGTSIWYEGQTNEYDFVLAIDTSSSMSATDFTPNRLEAAKDAALNFLNNVINVEVGVVSFSGNAFTEQELTDDMYNIKSAIGKLEIKTLGGTDIGGAIVNSVNILQKSKKDSKMIILLTDGQSNVGIDLQDAVDYANKNGISVNTIGMASKEGAEVKDLGIVSKLDEESLKAIAESTDGNYYSVQDKSQLSDVYNKIASITEKRIKRNLSALLILLALILLFVEWALVNTKYKTIP